MSLGGGDADREPAQKTRAAGPQAREARAQTGPICRGSRRSGAGVGRAGADSEHKGDSEGDGKALGLNCGCDRAVGSASQHS